MRQSRNHRKDLSMRPRIATTIAWLLAGAWAIWALVRTFGLDWGLPMVQVLAFTPFVAAAAAIPIAFALLVRRYAAAAVAVLAAIALAAAVLPRAFGGPTEPEGDPGPTLRVLAANMMLGEGDPAELVALVERLDVDVLSVEELTPELAAELDRAGLSELLPKRRVFAEPGSFGGGLYTRLPMPRSSTVALPGGFPLVHGAIELAGAPAIEAYSVHTQPPTPSRTDAWDDDLRALPGASETPLRIMLGDFNATLDHDEFRELLDRGYADVAATLGDGLTTTWPELRRLPPLVTIDHVIVDERIGIRDYSTHVVADTDHRAVYAELELPAG